MSNTRDSKERFSATIEYYHRYRPDYPETVIQMLIDQCGLNNAKIIADVGMGTGIFTKQLLESGYTVFGVEPNPDMRNAAIQFLSKYKNFKAVDGSSELTQLSDHSVDIITAAQAFHWFNQEKTKQEFIRILKPQGWVILVWNLRENNTAFMQDYENLLQRYGKDYQEVAADKTVQSKDIGIEKFFLPYKVKIKTFPHHQEVDWDGCRGRLLSTSYTPKQGEAGYEAMLDAAQKIFDKHQHQGKVDFTYETKVYFGQLKSAP